MVGSSSISCLPIVPAHCALCMRPGGRGHDGQPWGGSHAHWTIKNSSAVNSDDIHMGRQMPSLWAQSMMSVHCPPP